MPKVDPLEKMREICLALPNTHETPTWGQPHFRVGDKIFAGCGEHKGRVMISFKLTLDHQEELIARDDVAEVAPYVGKHGWVSMDANRIKDWKKIAGYVRESYDLIALKPRKRAPSEPRAQASGPAKRRRTKGPRRSRSGL